MEEKSSALPSHPNKCHMGLTLKPSSCSFIRDPNRRRAAPHRIFKLHVIGNSIHLTSRKTETQTGKSACGECGQLQYVEVLVCLESLIGSRREEQNPYFFTANKIGQNLREHKRLSWAPHVSGSRRPNEASKYTLFFLSFRQGLLRRGKLSSNLDSSTEFVSFSFYSGKDEEKSLPTQTSPDDDDLSEKLWRTAKFMTHEGKKKEIVLHWISVRTKV